MNDKGREDRRSCIYGDDRTVTVYFSDGQNRSVSTGNGTYRQTSANTYTEAIVNSVNKSLKSDKIEITFKIIDGNFLHLRFFVKKDGLGNPLNRWYEEFYMRVTPANNSSFLNKMVKLNSSQNKQKSEEKGHIFAIPDKAPVFTGEGTLSNWVASRIRYPEEAMKANIQGRVYIKFVIEEDGSVTNIEVLRGGNEALDNEAMRVVKTMPRWKPGTLNGKAVRCSYQMPINFRLHSPVKKSR